jgi:hypothetical protein
VVERAGNQWLAATSDRKQFSLRQQRTGVEERGQDLKIERPASIVKYYMPRQLRLEYEGSGSTIRKGVRKRGQEKGSGKGVSPTH